jgi:3-phenylpropionate/trans-cinnamate dioxygenase ferredoxin subunit
MSAELMKVGAATDVPAGEARRFDAAGTPVCVVNLGESGWRAVNDVCSHAEAYLHEGEVEIDDETIECPRHGSTFDLNTGAAKTLPATHPVATYPVKVEGDEIWIEVETSDE